MNEELTLVWTEKVLGKFSFGRRLLSWDSFECHMMDSVKEAVKTSNSDLVIVPGGCTKYIQAPDVCWNKPFKEFIGTKYDHRIAEGVHQYTEAGNMKPPPKEKDRSLDIRIMGSSFKGGDSRVVQVMCAESCK